MENEKKSAYGDMKLFWVELANSRPLENRKKITIKDCSAPLNNSEDEHAEVLIQRLLPVDFSAN